MAKQADGNGVYAFQSDEYRRAFLSSLKVRWSKVQEQTLRDYQAAGIIGAEVIIPLDIRPALGIAKEDRVV